MQPPAALPAGQAGRIRLTIGCAKEPGSTPASKRPTWCSTTVGAALKVGTMTALIVRLPAF